jgi:hypothetical protein
VLSFPRFADSGISPVRHSGRSTEEVIEEGIGMKKADTGSSQRPLKKYPTIGACGLDCGLCPRYYTVGSSRCPGCAGPGFFDKHPSCSFITCCVKGRGLEVCAECQDFPCSRFKTEEEYRQVKDSPSYPPCAMLMPNMRFVKAHGLRRYVEQQKRRMALLETMLERFDDGRSKSFYCRAAALLGVPSLRGALTEAHRKIQSDGVTRSDRKTKATILRTILHEAAPEAGHDGRVRRGGPSIGQ